MNIISFLKPAAKSGDAGTASHGPADVQAGTGFAAMLAQVLGSLGVPTRSQSSAAPLPNTTIQGDAVGTGEASAEDGVTVSGSEEPMEGEMMEVDGLDAFLVSRTPQRVLENIAVADTVRQSVGDLADAEDPATDGGDASLTSQANAAGTDDAIAPAGTERMAAAAFENIRSAQSQLTAQAESAMASQTQARRSHDAPVADDMGRANARAATISSQPMVGALLRDMSEADGADHRRGSAGSVSPTDGSIQPERPSVPALHTIESMTTGTSKDAPPARHVPATPSAAAERLLQMFVEPPIGPGSTPTEERQPFAKPQGQAVPVRAERGSTEAHSTEHEAEAVAPGRGEVAAPRVMPVAESAIPRITNTPGGATETAIVREVAEPPQQPDAPKGSFDSVSLRVNNADGTPTRIRVSVRGDEVRTTIIENDAGSAQRMVSRGDDLQQSLAARGFSKTTLSVHGPAARAPEVAVSAPVPVDRGDAGSSPDGRAERDGDRTSQRDQPHDRPDTDRSACDSGARAPDRSRHCVPHHQR